MMKAFEYGSYTCSMCLKELVFLRDLPKPSGTTLTRQYNPAPIGQQRAATKP